VYAAGPERYANLGMQYAKERRIEPQTLTEARSQLKNIVRHGGALLDVLRRTRGATVTALNDMRGVAIDIGFRPATLGQLETELEWLVQAAERASRLPEVKDHKGPARQRSAREVARHAADDFYAITGKKPTRNTFMKAGGFGEFLDRIFRALHIAERAASFEQEAVSAWKARNPRARKMKE
jgi:hypothetical protein